MNNRILMLMIEPTPYVAGFVAELRSQWGGAIDIVYVGCNLSQCWGESTTSEQVLPGGVLADVRTLNRLLRPDRYSLVHLAGWGHPRILSALLICGLRGIPVAVESDTPRRHERGGVRTLVKRLIYPWLFRIPCVFFPGGKRQADYLREYAVAEERIRIAGMTVDVEGMMAYNDALTDELRAVIRSRFGLIDQAVIFLYVGRLEAYKGVSLLLQSFARLKQRTMVPCALLVVGDGTLCREVKSFAEKRLDVVAAGRLAGTDLFDAYGVANALILPSFKEHWGLVINEAMAFGLPVIVSDAVGCADDLVVDGGNGWIFPVGDSDALAEAMESLCEDLSQRQRMSIASRQRISPWTLRNEAARVIKGWEQAKQI